MRTHMHPLAGVIACVAVVLSAGAAEAGIVNGDFTDSTLTDGTVDYEDIDAGWFSKNAGSNWVIQNEELLQASNSGSATRAGQAFSADDLSGTGWFLNFDIGGDPGTFHRVQLFAGVDDGNNKAGDKVLGFGGDDAPNKKIVQGDSWTTLVDEEALPPGTQSFSIAADLGGFDLMAVRFKGKGNTVGSTIDNVELALSAPPPPPPLPQGLVNGDFSDPTIVRAGNATYGDLAKGWVGKNAYDGDPGTKDNWQIINEQLVQTSNSDSATRVGQVFLADDMTGTGWSLEFDLTMDGLTRLQLFGGVDDGDNLITQKVLAMGDDKAPKGDIVESGWTTLLDVAGLAMDSHSFPIAEDLGDFDLLALRFRGTGGTVGATIDNVRFTGEDVIPEPATLALCAMAACGLAGYVRRRREA